ncbi:MAG TPA: hypothetical protein VF494_03845 [Candidatus Limnocylindrales bacterium]
MAIDTGGAETGPEKERTEMVFNAGTWPTAADDPAEARDRYHRVALYEARIATEHGPHRATTTAQRSFVARVRAAVGLSPSAPDAVACSVC